MKTYSDIIDGFIKMREAQEEIERRVSEGYSLSTDEQLDILYAYRTVLDSHINMTLKLIDIMETDTKSGKKTGN